MDPLQLGQQLPYRDEEVDEVSGTPEEVEESDDPVHLQLVPVWCLRVQGETLAQMVLVVGLPGEREGQRALP